MMTDQPLPIPGGQSVTRAVMAEPLTAAEVAALADGGPDWCSYEQFARLLATLAARDAWIAEQDSTISALVQVVDYWRVERAQVAETALAAREARLAALEELLRAWVRAEQAGDGTFTDADADLWAEAAQVEARDAE